MYQPSVAEDIQREGDAILAAWGRAARQINDSLGYPRSSCISAMSEALKVFDGVAKDTGREPTATGKQKKSRKSVDMQVLPENFMKIDKLVAQSPNQMQKVLKRAYLWGQPDRIAARELRIERKLFTEQREAAVTWVMRRL